MSTTPTLNGQVLGQAERATRAVLDRMLERHGLGFHEWVAVNRTATTEGGTIHKGALVGQLGQGLKIDEAAARAAVDSAVAAGVLAEDGDNGDGDTIGLTDAGRTEYERITGAIAHVTARLYGDLPAEDLATAGRVLTIVTERANALLATH
jgi:hypothetical protein